MPNDKHRMYVDKLTPEYKMVIRISRELYHSKLELFLSDLENRLRNPHAYGLTGVHIHRIRANIPRIKKLQAYQKTHHVKLTNYL